MYWCILPLVAHVLLPNTILHVSYRYKPEFSADSSLSYPSMNVGPQLPPGGSEFSVQSAMEPAR